jgi:hypothetical protein
MVEHKLQIRSDEICLHPSHVRKWVEFVATKMHNTFEKQDSIHRDAIFSGLSLEMFPIGRPLCIFIAREVALHIRRRVEVTDFGTWGGHFMRHGRHTRFENEPIGP